MPLLGPYLGHQLLVDNLANKKKKDELIIFIIKNNNLSDFMTINKSLKLNDDI